MSSSLTSEQQAAAYASSSVVVTAGAGTGKTHMLAERYLYYLRDRDLSPLEIVAVTFTEKAATELRSRIRFLASQQLGERNDILAELEAAQISTIHALSARICQEHFQAIEIPADFSILEDLSGKIWLKDALSAAIAKLPKRIFSLISYSLLTDILTRLLDDPYTAKLAFKQGIQDWKKLLADARLTALMNLVNDSVWHESYGILERYEGEEGDKLEDIRRSVIAAMADIEAEVNVSNAIAIIEKANLRGGSKKNWQSETEIKIIKDALKAVRELVKEATKEGLIDLELTAADERLQKILPALNEAYLEVSSYLDNLKRQARVLTFSDLEIYALQGLENAEVREYYRQRWRVFLVDEFQDTNPTQAELLTLLTENTELTIVGDIKQSIYGFRRADIRVFKQFRDRIIREKGKEVILSKSFRTHQKLIDRIDRIFAPLLLEDYQALSAYRLAEPINKLEEKGREFDYLEVLIPEIEPNSKKINRKEKQQLEAELIAQKIKQMLDNKISVYDKKTQQLRSVEPRNIAILTRTWKPLGIYERALSALNIPVAAAGGGNLLATREAKDASALLRFLADIQDDIALVALLRSPFFAISDRILFEIATEKENFRDRKKQESVSWWQLIRKSQKIELKFAVETLNKLLIRSQEETPSRSLKIADKLTGYTAIIANLDGAARRLADWQEFESLIKELESGTRDLFGVVRQLKQLYDNEVAVPRPILTVNNAVSLMTIFAAKGLEWSVVVIADLSRQSPQIPPPVYFDSQFGVAVKSPNETGETEKSVLYTWLEYQQKQKENAEAIRVLYVALTRARDYLILSGTDSNKGDLKKLQPSLAAASISLSPSSHNETMCEAVSSPTLPLSRSPTQSENPIAPLLLNSVGSGLDRLPVTALTEYIRCPQRFRLNIIQGHPGIGEGMAAGMQVGTLVHKALEKDIDSIKGLLPYGESSWNESVYTTAINMARQFRTQPIYKTFRQETIAKEKQISWQIGKITFDGVVDLVGKNWILDYKSDRDMFPQEHRLQLWAYARALKYNTAHIAYLRHDTVYSFNEIELNEIDSEVAAIADKIYQGEYEATPTIEKCAICPYLAFCDFAIF